MQAAGSCAWGALVGAMQPEPSEASQTEEDVGMYAQSHTCLPCLPAGLTIAHCGQHRALTVKESTLQCTHNKPYTLKS